MSPIIQPDEFDKSMIPSKFKTETKETIEIAAMLGWRIRLTTDQGMTIIAPTEDRKRYHFGLNGRSTVSHNRIRRDIVRYGDPTKVALAAQAIESRSPEMNHTIAGVLAAMNDSAVEDLRKPKVEAKPRNKAGRRSESEPVQRVSTPSSAKAPAKKTAVPKPTPSAPAVSVKAEPRIISSRPMIARAGDEKGYESKTTLERKWSDGTTDYTCTACDYSSVERLSVSRHYGVSHSKGRQPDPKTFKTTEVSGVGYAPNKRRVAALAQALIEVAGGEVLDEAKITEVARTALTWVHDQSRKGTEHAAEREPLTPEETLSRIKALIDDGSHFNALQDLAQKDEEITSLVQRVEEAEAKAAAAEVRADEAQSTLRAFRDLVSEIAPDVEREVG